MKKKTKLNLIYVFLTAVLLCGGCFGPEQRSLPLEEPVVGKKAVLTRLSPAQYPLFSDDMLYDGLEHGILKSLEYLYRLPPDRTFTFGEDTYTAEHMIKTLDLFLSFMKTNPSRHRVRAFIEDKFAVYTYRSFEIDDEFDYEKMEADISRSISFLKKADSDKEFLFGKVRFKAGSMTKELKRFLKFLHKKPDPEHIVIHIRSSYRLYNYFKNGLPVNVLYTGYYEPFLVGSLEKDSTFRYPVYSLPDDLAVLDLSPFSERFKGEKIIGRFTDGPNFVPYYTRKEIDSDQVLKGKVKPIAWVNNKTDLFFLEIQGSGTIYLNNGQIIKAHYHNSNGRPYKSIGAYLIHTGRIPKEEMSMQRIRAYLRDHPEEAQKILNYNPSYIFFKIEEDGPLGCLNVKLTPGRSIATDRKRFPGAALAYIETQKPLIDGDENIQGWLNFSRFALNQDTGGAIRGPGRADLFWGNGNYAEIAAGYMQHPGNLHILVLKQD